MTEQMYRLLVAAARRSADHTTEPRPGDLVVEVTSLRKLADPDAIGWLVGHDEAAYAEDGSGPMRDVWDVLPLNPQAKLQTIGDERLQRWENASFAVVPDTIREGAGLEPPTRMECPACFGKGLAGQDARPGIVLGERGQDECPRCRGKRTVPFSFEKAAAS